MNSEYSVQLSLIVFSVCQKLFQQKDIPKCFSCVLVLPVFHVVLNKRIMGNKAFFTHLVEEDKKNLACRVVHLSNILSTI